MKDFISIGCLVACAMTIGGCAASPSNYEDIPPDQVSQWIGDRQLNSPAGSHVLTVSFLTDAPELSIERLGYDIRGGNLYLWPERGRHRFEPVAFNLDTSKLKLRQPWRQHVYWLIKDQWDGPIERLEQPGRGQYVKRIHAAVSEAPPPDATTRPESDLARVNSELRYLKNS